MGETDDPEEVVKAQLEQGTVTARSILFQRSLDLIHPAGTWS